MTAIETTPVAEGRVLDRPVADTPVLAAAGAPVPGNFINPVRQKPRFPKWARVVGWVAGIPVALLLLIYLVLLIVPIPLAMFRDPVQGAIVSAMPAGSTINLGNMDLALEDGTVPVLRFSPVTYTDVKTGAKVTMDALEVGFSPFRALLGQPGATITIVGPHLQINQDLFGPRLATLDVVADPTGGRPTVRVMEGSDTFPEVGISPSGIDVRGELPVDTPKMRSDNDWLIYNLEAAAEGVGEIIEQARQGRFSRLIVRGGTLDMNDALYGLFRTFNDISVDITAQPDGKVAEGQFSARFGGSVMQGIIERIEGEDGVNRLKASVNNLDLASFMPFIDDPDAMMSVSGTSALSMDLAYSAETGKLADGTFRIDMTGTDLRIGKDMFPIATNIAEVHWTPATGEFALGDMSLAVDKSTATISGIFRLGLDDTYGPTVGISMKATNVRLYPNDLAAPEVPFEEMSFTGWSAPLYGAMGIDQFVATKPGARMATKGRIDMLQRGMGFQLTIGGEGITADDLKRLWPYFIATDSRDWFVKNVTDGVIETSTMKYDFPPGALAEPGEEGKPLPPNSMYIEILGKGVVVKATDTMAPIAVDGATRLVVVDNNVTISADGGKVPTATGDIGVKNAAIVIDSANPDHRVIEISGDVSGGIPALLSLAKEQQPEALASADLPIDLDGLTGNVDLSLVATIQSTEKDTKQDIDYVVNGRIVDFASAQKIEDRTIGNGQLTFAANQDGYRLSGTAEVDAMPADIMIAGKPDNSPPIIQLASTVNADDLKKFGFDASEFLTGSVKFTAEPRSDGSLGIAIDLKDAGLTIKDVGITKAAGVPGLLSAVLKQDGKVSTITDVDLAFGSVHLAGGMTYDADKGLQSVDLTDFQLSDGDKATASLTPTDNGFALRVRGDQLDLKPMLKRFFNLSEGTGGVQAQSIKQTIALDIELKRALGMYKTTVFNLDLDLALRGTDIIRASLQGGLGDDRSVSMTTNPGPTGKVMSVAINDMGTLLRFLGVYPNVLGGQGTLVLQTVNDEKMDVGRFQLANFSIVDEEKVAEILGNHAASRELISQRNRIDFRSARVDFVRRSDRVEVTEGLLSGNEVGGTIRGFIYTDQRTYDLVGTYVPLFGLNSAFQKIPIFGPLLGGRDGEGLFGVTFAIRGPLDKPDFKINPASALALGAFRSLFEFRAKEQPRVDQ